jgi:hypothetical protein
MAPLPYMPGIARCSFTWDDGVATFGSRIFLDTEEPGISVDDLNTLAGAVKGVYASTIAASIAEEYVLTQVECRDLSSVSSNTGYWVGAEAGGQSGSAVSSNVSQDIQLGISSSYRGGHPVLHLPGSVAANLGTARTWTDAQKAAMSSAAEDFREGVNDIPGGLAGDVQWIVLRGYRPGATPEEVNSYQVNTTVLRKYVGTMRRRARALR